ncbi:MAG: PAS domain S-box protein [Kofleriaceae bacterium]
MGIAAGGWFLGRSARAIEDFFDLCEASSDEPRTQLSAARDGNWLPLERHYHALGQRYARERITTWPELYRALVPRFVTTFVTDPDRLTDALLVLGEYQERSHALIAHAYYATLEPLELQHGEVLAASLDSVISIDAVGHVVEFNAAASKTFGYPRQDVIGQLLSDLIIPERFREAHRDGLARVVATGETRAIGRRLELVGLRADGSEFPIELSLIATTRLDGERRFTAFLRDLSEQKRAEESIALWAHTLEQAQFGVVISDIETRQLRRVNRAYARMVGYELAELDGIDGLNLMGPGPRPNAVEISRTINERGLSTIEMWLLRKDGTSFPALASTSTVELRPGVPVRVSTVIDISERYELEQTRIASRLALEQLVATLEQRVAERTAELETANRELETFSYTVSHDLRSPLRAIDGFSRALVTDYADQLDDNAKHYFERIRAGTQRMASLIDDLLKLARIGRVALRRSELDVSALAAHVITELRAHEPARVVDVVIADGLCAWADPALVRIVLENLLGNAWKFTSKTERATITLDGDGPTFRLRDNGAGFDMAHLDKLFVPFQRLHAVNDFEGSGIGLATVHRIVRHHGGRIWAEAELGQGATLFFTLGGKP